MEEMHFELAADYLVMASTLTEIKSKLLLPVETEIEDEEDPRANLIKRLLEYQKYKNASEQIENLPRNYRDFYVVSNAIETKKRNTIDIPDIKIEELFFILFSGPIFLRWFRLYVLSFMFRFMFANICFEKNQNSKIHVMFNI